MEARGHNQVVMKEDWIQDVGNKSEAVMGEKRDY